MKRVLFFIVVALLSTFVFLLWVWPKKFDLRREIVVRQSMPRVTDELLDLNKWERWYPGWRKYLFSIIAGNSSAVVVTYEHRDPFSFEAFPGEDSLHTRIVWRTKVGFMNWLLGQREHEMARGMDSLKGLLEK